MSAPRVVLTNQYFPPDTSATSDLARRLVDALRDEGADVSVVAGRPSYRPSADVAVRGLRLAARDGRVLRVRSARFDRTSLVRRASNYLTYLALSTLPIARAPADAFVSMTDPPFMLLLVTPIALARRIPVVYWLQDFHPEFLLGIGRIRRSPLTALWSRYHRWCMRRAAAVVVLGRDMRQRVLDAGVRPERIHIVPNGSAFDWPDDEPPERLAHDELVVVHAGEIGMRGAWETLIGAARQLRGVARFVLLGDGVDAPRVRELAADLDNVEIHPPVPSAEVASWLNRADATLVMVRARSEGYSVPSKVYELLGAGAPIIVMARPDAEPALLVSEVGCGIVVDPDDPDAVATDIRELAGDADRRAAMGARAFAARDEFRRDDMIRRVARVVLGVRR